MRLGLWAINFGACADPELQVRAAVAAEGSGFESIWTSEHVAMPIRDNPVPMPPETPFLDSMVSLANVAAHTSRLRLGTGILVMPHHNPVLLAKALATLDLVSGGRLIAGFAGGYVEAEFRALGVSFKERGAITDEYLQAIRVLWTEEVPRFAGRFAAFDGIRFEPKRPAAASAHRHRRAEPACAPARRTLRERVVRLRPHGRRHGGDRRRAPAASRRARPRGGAARDIPHHLRAADARAGRARDRGGHRPTDRHADGARRSIGGDGARARRSLRERPAGEAAERPERVDEEGVAHASHRTRANPWTSRLQRRKVRNSRSTKLGRSTPSVREAASARSVSRGGSITPSRRKTAG